jgi:hypothetical protein
MNALAPHPRRNVPVKIAIRVRRAEVAPATVQMEDRFDGSRNRRVNPNSRDTADRPGFERRVVTRQNALHQAIEGSAGFDAPHCALAGERRGSDGADDGRIFGVERMFGSEPIFGAGRSRRLHRRGL